MRKIRKQRRLTPPRDDKSRQRDPIEHYAPEAVPHLAEAYFEARDRRRSGSGVLGQRSRALRKFTIMLCAFAVGALTFIFLTDGVSRVATPKSVHGDLEKLAIAAGFGIDQVSLKGHRYTIDDDIFDALDLPNMRSLLSFEPSVLRERLQQLPWIKTVEASRIYPSQLQIRITEREPAAVWQRGGRDYLIDSGGRTLAAVSPGVLDHLPRLRGEGADALVGHVFALLQRFPDLAAFVTTSERVGERRWTFRLVGGGAVHLPTEQEVQALETFLAHPNALALIQSGASVIDLRAKGRISVRPVKTDTKLSSRRPGVG